MPVTFTPVIPPQEEPAGEITFNITEIRFGEGYIQAVGEGLHEKRQDWPLTWNGTDSEITSIKNFFDARKGFESFYWTPPFGVQGLYRVKKYQLIPAAAGNARLSALLEQVFAP